MVFIVIPLRLTGCYIDLKVAGVSFWGFSRVSSKGGLFGLMGDVLVCIVCNFVGLC